MSSFGDRVRSRRLSIALRQTDFAQHGITQSQLSMIESDSIEPSPEKIEKIAAVLRITALELVAGTDLESNFLASRFTDDEIAVILEAAQFSRSERLVALQESYDRIWRFFKIAQSGSNDQSVGVIDEAHYQQTVRILRRSLDAAREYDSLLAEGIFVPPSLMDEPDAWSPRAETALQRSAALITSLVIEYRESDSDAARRVIVLKLGLDRIDEYLERRATGSDGNGSQRAW